MSHLLDPQTDPTKEFPITRMRVEVQPVDSVESSEVDAVEPFEPNAVSGQDNSQGTPIHCVLEFDLLSSFGGSNEAVFEILAAGALNGTQPHLAPPKAGKEIPVRWPVCGFIVILFGLGLYSTAFALYVLLCRTSPS